MGKKRSEMKIDLLKTLADDFLTEAWKLEPLTKEYHALNESQKKKFDAALERLFSWLDQMKPEGIINFWTEYDAMLVSVKPPGDLSTFSNHARILQRSNQLR